MRQNAARRDEQANVELARRIAREHDASAVAEVVTALGERTLESDAIKVLDEVGAIDAALIAPHAEVLLDRLASRNNRVVWGAMAALAHVVPHRRALLVKHLATLRATADAGSVITRDGYVNILIGLAPGHAKALPVLAEQFEGCPLNQLPMYAERALAALGAEAVAPFAGILARRIGDLPTPAKRRRVEKVLGRIDPAARLPRQR